MLDRILQHGRQHEHSATTRLNPGSDHDNYGASLIRNQRDNHCRKDGEWFKPTSDPCYPNSVSHLHGTHINGVANGASTLLPEGQQLQVKIFQSCRKSSLGLRLAEGWRFASGLPEQEATRLAPLRGRSGSGDKRG